MLLCLLFAFSIGIEGGYSFPAVGFKDINTGMSFSLFALRAVGFVDAKLAVQTAYYTGDNTSYHYNTSGLQIGIQKNSWLISPVLAIGGYYTSRSLNQSTESGLAAAYSIGAILNFHIERLHIYPKLCYEGLTDMKTHAGFIGLKLGVGYEI
jgi:hypothetical protein